MSLPALAAQAPTPRYEMRAAAVAVIKPRSCLSVFLALEARLGTNTTVWPTIAVIMADTGCSERTVRRALRALEAAGWIVPVASDRRANEYEVRVGAPVEELVPAKGAAVAPQGADRDPLEAASTRGPSVTPQGAIGDPPGGQRWPVGGPAVTPEPFHEPSKELERTRQDARARTHEGPAGQLSLTPEPPTTSKPEPGKGRKKPKPAQPPPPDPVWNRFAELAVETGLVERRPDPTAGTHRAKADRAQVLGELVAAHGAARVLEVWRWVLTSPDRSAVWWRDARQGPELIRSFLVAKNFGAMLDSQEAARRHGPRLQALPGGKGTFGRLPEITPDDYGHESDLARRTLGKPVEEENDDALCW